MLGNFLFGIYRRRVLALLLLHPEHSYHVREIARLTGTTAGTLHKELARLAEVGLLQRQQLGNQIRYSANLKCPIFDELRSILRKTSGIVDVLRDALITLSEQVVLAFIFGSVARGEERTGSDIDLLVVGDAPFAKVVKALDPAQKITQREINPAVYTPMEFVEKLRGGDAFLREVTTGEKLWLLGERNESGESSSHSSSRHAHTDKGQHAENPPGRTTQSVRRKG